MKENEIDKSKIFIDRRYAFTMDDGRVLIKRGNFLMVCDSVKGYHVDERKLSHIIKITEQP